MSDELARFIQPSLKLPDPPTPAAKDTQRPRRRRRKPEPIRTSFELELLDAPCRRHSMLAVCDECVPLRGRDSTGFPSAQQAFGRGRYRVCPACDKLQQIGEWDFVSRCCQRCAGSEGSETAAPIAKPAPPSQGWRITRR